MKRFLSACLLLVTAFTSQLAAQQMDYGPFLGATYEAPGGNTVYRGIAVPFDAKIPGEMAEGPIGQGKYGKIAKKGNKDIAGTSAPEIYRTNRAGFGGYKLNVPPGTYKVTLHFCELAESAKDRRVFDVLLQGKKVAEALDIYARVGQNKALDLTFEAIEVGKGEQLVIGLNKQKGDTLLCGLIVEGKGVTRKIRSGGAATKGYAADWPANFDPVANLGKAGVIFDAEMLRYAAVWTGGFLKMEGVVFTGAHGPNPSPQGEIKLATKLAPGWASNGNLVDPRPANLRYGPLPRPWARYKGMYRHDDGVLFKYSVGDCDVLDLPTFEAHEGLRFFCRTLNLQPSGQDREVLLADCDSAEAPANSKVVTGRRGADDVVVSFNGGPAGTRLAVRDGKRIVLQIPTSKEVALIKIGQWAGSRGSAPTAATAFSHSKPAADLTPLTKGGKTRFAKTVSTKGVRGSDTKGAYTVDTIAIPAKNPYNSKLRFGGVDFFADGRAAITTWDGDVWVVSGIDEKLENVTWKRFASGLFQPLGVKIVNGVVHVLCRDGVFRLHDLNNDGEADFYECFNNDWYVTSNFHEFIFELHNDKEGNFYFLKGGPVKPGGRGWDFITPSHGSLFKLSKDGMKLEVIARGFRAPNGMGLGPNGELTTGDNEGTWVPTSPLNWIKPGGFYGVPDFSQRNPMPKMRDNPLCWLPKTNSPYGDYDNSSGCQVWITGKNFGPLSGQMLHTSYGTCTLFNVLKEEVGGQMQGGVVALPLKFDTGIMRARFVEKDNALYLVGLRGWQTTATKDAAFHRVRYTGKPAHVPVNLQVKPATITISFSDPLDKESVEKLGNYGVQRWNYRWTETYGSPHFKTSNPMVQGHDDMEVTSANLSPDGKTVTLAIKDIKPVMQMRIIYRLKAADGAAVSNQILHTINAVGDMRGEVHVGEYKIVKGK